MANVAREGVQGKPARVRREGTAPLTSASSEVLEAAAWGLMRHDVGTPHYGTADVEVLIGFVGQNAVAWTCSVDAAMPYLRMLLSSESRMSVRVAGASVDELEPEVARVVRLILEREIRQRTDSRRTAPLTYEEFARAWARAEADRAKSPVFVQVRKSGAVLCGRILDAVAGKGGSAVDFFQVNTALGNVWAAHANVRMCSGDGRCVCESEPTAAAYAERSEPCAAAVPPLGNTGGTVQGGTL